MSELNWINSMSIVGYRQAIKLQVEVVDSISHDENSFTQGLLINNGYMFESAGNYSTSYSLAAIDLSNANDTVSHSLGSDFFAEGLALVGERLVQLTWKEHVAFQYDINSIELGPLDETFDYSGEGWGLCFNGSDLIMSDGSDQLFFRDANSFAVIDTVNVTRDGESVLYLNELECVGDMVFANVWHSDDILVIDPDSGEVVYSIDASDLLTPEQASSANVLNGIAYDIDTDKLWITGKYWPTLFQVDFIDEVTQEYIDITYAQGDLNNDYSVNVQDVVIMMGLVLGDISFNSLFDSSADINEDGLVNILDIVVMIDWILADDSADLF